MALSVIQLPNFYFWKCSAQKKGPQISSRQGPDGPLLSISSAPLQKCSTFRYDPHAGLFHPSYTAYTAPTVPIVPMDPYLGWKSRTVTSVLVSLQVLARNWPVDHVQVQVLALQILAVDPQNAAGLISTCHWIPSRLQGLTSMDFKHCARTWVPGAGAGGGQKIGRDHFDAQLCWLYHVESPVFPLRLGQATAAGPSKMRSFQTWTSNDQCIWK